MENRLMRYAEAYVRMADEARYRPRAPGDGMGNVILTSGEIANAARLKLEAVTYAKEFSAEEDELAFTIGCSCYETNRALIYTIEAARLLCAGGKVANQTALRLLKMATKEIQAETKPKAA